MNYDNQIAARQTQSIFKLCMELKTVGVDAFFNWSPHVEWIEVWVYENGWQRSSDPDREFLNVDRNNIKQLKEVKKELTALLKKHRRHEDQRLAYMMRKYEADRFIERAEFRATCRRVVGTIIACNFVLAGCLSVILPLRDMEAQAPSGVAPSRRLLEEVYKAA